MKTYCIYVVIALYFTGSTRKTECQSIIQADNKICIPIKECTEVLNLILTKPLTDEIRQQIINFKCAQDAGGVKVWCDITETVNNKECLPIKECMEILDLLRTKPITNKMKEYIKSLKCGDSTRFPKVWCNVNYKNIGRDHLPDPAAEECGIQTKVIVPVVAGGEDANYGEFPWMAMLEYRIKNNKLAAQCGGSLINNRYILTAAHCLLISARQGKLESILLGVIDLNKLTGDEQRCNVETISVHPSYEASAKASLFHNDIGLVRVKEEVIYTDVIFPICLPPHDFKETMDHVEIAGWGTTENGIASAELQKLVVPYYDTAECTKLLRYNVTETQLCAGGEAGKNSCKGDSGGPLMYYSNRYTTQVGIVSLSIGKSCGAGRPNIYTNVQKFLLWIYDTIKP